jgi:hypothetical protein
MKTKFWKRSNGDTAESGPRPVTQRLRRAGSLAGHKVEWADARGPTIDRVALPRRYHVVATHVTARWSIRCQWRRGYGGA